MDDPKPPGRDPMQDIGEVFACFADALRPVGEALNRGMKEFFESSTGRYLLAVAKYYEEHPDELNAMIAAREAEAQSWDCHCLCQRWDHLGVCTGERSTTTAMYLDGKQMQVPMCRACSSAIADYRLALR